METFRRGDLTFDVVETGPATGEGIVLLHGFPETSSSWDGVVPALAEAGYRTLAPNQRGYSPRARPVGRRAYRMDELVADVVALLDQAGVVKAHVVGHDWGGAVAWAIADQHPDRLHTLTVLSTPHPAAMQRSLVSSSQLLKSWYMFAFQLPALPERFMLADGGERARKQLADSGLPADKAGEYVRHLSEPGALTAALNWYRALPLSVRSRIGRISVPTLYVWSTADIALGRRAAELTGRYVDAPYRFEILDGVSHWIPEEEPAATARLILEHIRSSGGG